MVPITQVALEIRGSIEKNEEQGTRPSLLRVSKSSHKILSEQSAQTLRIKPLVQRVRKAKRKKP